MPVYKDKKNSTYTVRFYTTDPMTGRKQVFKRGFKTKREATAWEAEQKAKKMSEHSSATFWDVFQRQLDDNDTSPGTRRKKESWISMYFKPYKNMQIEKITKAQLVEWRNDLKTAGLAVRTMNCGLQYIRSVFTFYSAVYGFQNTGIVLKSFKLTKDNKTEIKVWTPKQFEKFLDYVNYPVYKAFFSFLYWTGCRRGEAVALTKDCFKGNQCRIYRAMKHYKDGFTPLKTDSSERTITIDSELMEVLNPLIEQADPFVFGGVHPVAIRKIDLNFRNAIKKANLKPIRLHDLRHSHASFLLNNGANIMAVSKRLGHATITQTLETYAHLMGDTDEKMMQIIESEKGAKK